MIIKKVIHYGRKICNYRREYFVKKFCQKNNIEFWRWVMWMIK